MYVEYYVQLGLGYLVRRHQQTVSYYCVEYNGCIERAPHVVRRQSDAVHKTCAPRGGHIEGARGVVGPRRPTRVASLALSAGSLVRSPSTPPVRILAAGVPVII